MNKLLVGAIAGAAGVALLLGGAGTFALWNDSAAVAGGTIVAGSLDVTPTVAAGSWTVNGVAQGTLSGFKAVPGDVLAYTKTMNVTASGDNLLATLTLDPASISPTVALDAEDLALTSYLTSTATIAATATGAGISGTSPSYSVNAGTSVVTVTVTLTFPSGAGNDAQLGSVKLNDLNVTLNQTS
ncbi:alternate-type signal peptide domain-containing protein [Cryobacterium tagatosivorans]|uniref:Alternate-type signal peptide domain-containing protein n=1 Tax=Cryobacterium tagatosivorans TaxID=1259199 RepID=A0A4R8UAR2_9MICO|nr:alternate-type signal peptide domain-containing protein [Cryobacterium tagatosivorans]TFB47230.1 alternate-type signal peptide domain-containing protein [Cryobacterium tagatosivorans]